MINHTENAKTVRQGSAIATVIADSVNEGGQRITTLELVYPRYIHSELMTHRLFSRNASSSRATPVSVLTSEVENDPVFFDYVGTNQPGMVAGAELCEFERDNFRADWEKLGKIVAGCVNDWSKRYHIHKQTLNRALEPWSRIRTLVTATEWDNFFKLRCASDAQPEMRNLATAIMIAMGLSQPNKAVVHMPYAVLQDNSLSVNERCKVCIARCARVSYARLNGKENSIEDDLSLYQHLLECGHMSPFEHVAFARKKGVHYANFVGWQSYRHSLGY